MGWNHFIISGKASSGCINRAGNMGDALSLSARALASKEHLDWLKIDLNATTIITVQD